MKTNMISILSAGVTVITLMGASAAHAQQTFIITLRGGVQLTATVYTPGAGSYPVVLSYGHTWFSNQGVFNAAGYAVVDVETRSLEFTNDEEDCYDIIDWISKQPWCDGKVAMFGISRSAVTAWAGAKSGHPALKAIFPVSATTELWHTAYWETGAIQLAHMMNGRAVNGNSQPSQWWYLPLIDMDLQYLGYENQIWNDYITHSSYDSYWQPLDLHDKYDLIKVPVFMTSGWWDNYATVVLTSYQKLEEEGLVNEVRVRINNEGHLGDGQEHSVAIRWFDHVLKGINNGIENEPPLHLYIQGIDEWRYENEWPLARTQFINYYFHSPTGLRTGTMDSNSPSTETPTQFVYDPQNPCPTLGCSSSYLANQPGWINSASEAQNSLETRNDVLVFSTAPLTEDLEIVGPVLVKLYAATDATDTDWTAKLCDVYPNGTSYNRGEGIIRARFRNSIWQPPGLITPGQIYEYTIELDAIANVFKAGHRIRVLVSSSSFPLWDRNPNTGHDIGMDSQMQSANQTIYHDAAYPSNIILPVIPGDAACSH